MTASNANTGFGVELRIGQEDGPPETFVAIAELVGIPGFGATQRTSEVTQMASDAVEHIGIGLVEGKAFTVPLNFVADDTDQTSLYDTLVESGATKNYQIGFTDASGTNVTFAAIIQDVDINHDRDAHAQMSVTFLPTNGYTWGTDA